MAPVVGYARTATIRAAQPLPGTLADMRKLRHAYYRFVDAGPKPALIVIEDLDGANAGYGAFWGEVQSAIHRGRLGAIGGDERLYPRPAAMGRPASSAGRTVGPSHAFANLGGPSTCGRGRRNDGALRRSHSCRSSWCGGDPARDRPRSAPPQRARWPTRGGEVPRRGAGARLHR